jgi:ribonuclease Z
MFDCGPATTHKLVQAGLGPTQIDRLFFTHHHFDHNVDYPCFLLTRWDQGAGREAELSVYGPRLTRLVTDRLLDERTGAFAHDWLARVNHPASQRVFVNRGGVLPRRPPSVQVRDIGPGATITGRGWEVTSAHAQHVQPWLDSLAYRLDSREGSVVVTGDTEPCQSVIDLARDADTLICMCWDDREHMREVGESSGGCAIEDAAEMAEAAKVRRLVLTHMGARIAEPDRLRERLAEISRNYSGEIVVSHEIQQFEI